MRAAAAPMRVGWCPGALKPMPSGDGLIVRVRPRGGRLAAEQAIGIAAAAARFGNGALDLTSRANLQVRGLGDATLPGLTAALGRLGLLDVSPEAEARRNVVASPLAGLDPSAAFDIRPAVAALEDRLAADESLGGLPAKFGFAVSDGGAFLLDDVPADVRFDAVLDARGAPAFEIRLDGDPDRAAVCETSALPETAVRLARVFVDARRRDPGLQRMRDLAAGKGASAVFAAAGLESVRWPTQRSAAYAHCVGVLRLSVERSFADPSSGPADHRLPDGEKDSLVLGVGAPFGGLDAAQLDAVGRGAAAVGASELRLTPWRAVLIPGIAPDAVAALAAACADAGLIVDPDDPRLRVAACAGAPGCHRGTVSTLAEARSWAKLVGPGRGIALHVSGCAKGCAHAGAAPLTLVGRDGRYDVVVDGRPGDAPAVFGLDAGEARRLIRTAFRRDPRP